MFEILIVQYSKTMTISKHVQLQVPARHFLPRYRNGLADIVITPVGCVTAVNKLPNSDGAPSEEVQLSSVESLRNAKLPNVMSKTGHKPVRTLVGCDCRYPILRLASMIHTNHCDLSGRIHSGQHRMITSRKPDLKPISDRSHLHMDGFKLSRFEAEAG